MLDHMACIKFNIYQPDFKHLQVWYFIQTYKFYFTMGFKSSYKIYPMVTSFHIQKWTGFG